MRRISISADEDYVDRVDDRRESTTSRAQWFRGAGRMRLVTEEKADAFAEDLPEWWWEEALEEYLDRRRGQSPEPAEAD
ncbi:hypothetical protein [Halococcus sp. AFM35]|uniref:hypothetical protein n=1 Tax=Halococcus sp. AFM35 TaxID=3421653 RepID=UPI003EB91F78